MPPYLSIEGGQEPILHAIWGLQFYLFGMLFRLFEKDFDLLFRWFIPLSVLMVLLFKYGIIFDQGQRIVQYAYLLGYFSSFYVLKSSSIDFSKVGGNTMGIYLIHAPVVLKAVSLATLYYYSNGLLSLFVVAFICFMISYQITKLINSIPYGKVLFGSY